MLSEYRPIWVYADDTEIAVELRVIIRGRSNLTLLPDFSTIDIYNLSNEDTAILKNAKMMTVKVDRKATVCCGEIEGIYNHYEDTSNVVTTVAVSDGMTFWNGNTYSSYGKGASVFDVIRTIVKGKVEIGAFLCNDIRMPRGQVCCGKIAEIIETFAKTLGARAYVTNNVLSMYSEGRSENIFTLTSDDIIGSPDRIDDLYVLHVRGRSFSVGDLVNYNGMKMRIITRAVSMDSLKGDWDIAISLVDDNLFTRQEMEGGL